jgi:hypothetical protein
VLSESTILGVDWMSSSMRGFAAFIASVLLTSVTVAKPSVEVLRVEPSSQNARITVLHDGKPVQNVQVEVFTAKKRLRLSLTTDANGVVVIPKLPQGKYHIGASTPGHLGGDLLLEISDKKKTSKSEFSMQLSDRPLTYEEIIAAAEGSAPREVLQEFRGTAVDPAGMAIPKVRIQVFQRGTGGKGPVAIAETDATGHFAAHLGKGSYTATFVAQGFSMQIHVFEIADDGERKELRIRVDLGQTT